MSPHSTHWRAGAHERRDLRIITCVPLFSASLIWSMSFREKFPHIPRFLRSAFVSMTSISESSVPWKRSFSSTSSWRPHPQLYSSSSDGVADPRMMSHPWIRDNISAVSRPLYRGAGESCLYELSCSSSTIMSPRSWWGRKMDERVPSTKYPFPERMASAVLRLLAAVSAEWKTRSRSSKCSWSLSSSCLLNAISGTRYKTFLP